MPKNTIVYKIEAHASVGIKMAGIFLQRRKIAFWRSSLFEDFLYTNSFILTKMVRNDNFLVKTGIYLQIEDSWSKMTERIYRK